MTTTNDYIDPDVIADIDSRVDELSQELAALREDLSHVIRQVAALRTDVNHLDRVHAELRVVARGLHGALLPIIDAACPELDGNGKRLGQILDDVSDALWPDEDTEDGAQ